MLFRVWAPAAGDVQLALGTDCQQMTRGDDGWWSIDLPSVGAGIDYGFVVDGGGPFPDPRSPWQPHGVHGLARTVDHGAFTWHCEDWPATPLAQAVIYELHVGTFTPDGTFDSAIEKLDHLVRLGVTPVEVMPVARFSGERGVGCGRGGRFGPH